MEKQLPLSLVVETTIMTTSGKFTIDGLRQMIFHLFPSTINLGDVLEKEIGDVMDSYIEDGILHEYKGFYEVSSY